MSIRRGPLLSFALSVTTFAASAHAVRPADPIGTVGSGGGRVTVPSDAIVRKAPECAPLFKSSDGARASGAATTISIWEAAKAPALRDHCDVLARAVEHFRDGAYAQAVAEADQAERMTPGQPGPHVVRGEALSRWGRYDLAAHELEAARAIQPRALDDAETLDDYGVVLVRLDRRDEARVVFRTLLPRVSGPTGLCGARTECDAAGRAYWTAGLLAFERGAETIDEAVAMLREARARSELSRELRRIAGLTLALALDRRGDTEQARALVSEMSAARGVFVELPVEELARVPWPEERQAIRAFALEASDPVAAATAWRSYLSGGGDKRVWAAHARVHLVALEKPVKPVKPATARTP